MAEHTSEIEIDNFWTFCNDTNFWYCYSQSIL